MGSVLKIELIRIGMRMGDGEDLGSGFRWAVAAYGLIGTFIRNSSSRWVGVVVFMRAWVVVSRAVWGVGHLKTLCNGEWRNG